MSRHRIRNIPTVLRFFRSDIACVLLTALMIMVALVRPFTGTAILLHDHNDSGSHTHEASGVALSLHNSSWHHECHARNGFPQHENEQPCYEDCNVKVILLFADPHVPARPVTALTDTLTKPLITLDVSMFVVPLSVGLEPCVQKPRFVDTPRHLCALSAGKRIIATSHAILI